MRYAQTPAQSAELLRLVLPLIAQHGGHYVPTAYGVWYEHLAGVNPALSQALDPLLAQPGALDQQVIDQLCARHIEGRDNQNTERLQAGLGE